MNEPDNCDHPHHICRDCGVSLKRDPLTQGFWSQVGKRFATADIEFLTVMFVIFVVPVIALVEGETPHEAKQRQEFELRRLEVQAKICVEHRSPEEGNQK